MSSLLSDLVWSGGRLPKNISHLGVRDIKSPPSFRSPPPLPRGGIEIQTDIEMNIATFRLNQPRGKFSENINWVALVKSVKNIFLSFRHVDV